MINSEHVKDSFTLCTIMPRVGKAHYAYYYVRKTSIVLAGNGVRKMRFSACECSLSKIHCPIRGNINVHIQHMSIQ